jgi:PAS domain S-box-containing protein
MTYHESGTDKILRKKYILALSIIACLVILSQLAVQLLISKNEDDSRVINIAGRQRMLSQRINKCAFGIYMTEDPVKRAHYRAEMKEVVELWEVSQRGLKYGNAGMGLPGDNSEKVKELFAKIQQKHNIIISAARSILILETDKPVNNRLLKKEIQIITNNEGDFLDGMDQIVFQYDREAKAKVERVRRIEIGLMAITLIVLLMEAAFIFKPAVKHIKEKINRIRENEKIIADAKEEFKAIFENSQVGMALLKQYRLFDKANQRLADILGYASPDDLIGMSVLDIHLSEEHFRDFGSNYYESLTQGEQIQVEYKLKKKDGSPVWCTLSGKAIDANKPPDLNKGVLWVVDDISGKKASEEQLRRARTEAEAANIAKSEFLAQMSHELRTPLNAILGFTQLMARDESLSEPALKNLAIVNRSGEHLLAMINDVLDLSKIEAGKLELKEDAFDLSRTIEDVVEMIRFRARSKGLHFVVEPDKRLERYVRADLGKLRQVLINLLGNAVKFTDEGRVALRVRTAAFGQDHIRRYLEVEVQDTGPGIPREQLDAVFESFTQAGPYKAGQQGTGLGLTISRSFVQLMGGEITVESEVGKGTLFRVRVPVEVVPEGVVQGTAIPPFSVIGLERSEPEWRILIVDDNPDNVQLLETLLVQVGFSVRTCRNGLEGLETARQWRPHLIWMDMSMPVMDGYEATRRIRELPGGGDIGIFALTASVFKEEEGDILTAGCDGVLHKPFPEREIFDVMARHLGVRYRYDVKGVGDRKVVPESGPPPMPTAGEFAALPPETAQRIRQAAVELNKREVLAIAQEIEEEHPTITAFLKGQVVSFDFGTIERFLESAKGGKPL